MPLKFRITLLVFSAVFALIFGLGGMVAGVKPMANMLQDAWKARSYVAIPAQVLEVSLTRGGKSSRGVKARYRYELNGKTYESNRVGLYGGNADNIGDWQTEWHRKLLNAYKAQRTITVWVDPMNPADALIDRNIRWLMLLFLTPFALIFPAVSLGAMWFLFKTLAARPTSTDTVLAPDLDLNTAASHMADNNKNAAGFLWFFAVFWNLLCWPIALLTWLDRGFAMVSLFVSVFPIVGLFLLRLAIKATAQARLTHIAKSTPFDYLPLNTFAPIDIAAQGTAQPIPSMVMRTDQHQNVWSAVFSSWSARLTGLSWMAGAVYAFVLARERFLGSSSSDVLWALAWLAIAMAVLGLGLHSLSTARRLRVDPRGLMLTSGSWLWRKEQHFVRSEITGYAKKHVRFRGRHTPNRQLFEVYATTRTGEQVQLSPAVVHEPVADAIAGTVRDALANHALLFAPQGDVETAPPSRALLGYGLWGVMASIGLTAVSLNPTFRLGDPVSIERMVKDWTIRLERLSPGGRAFEAAAGAQDRADLATLKTLLEQGANPNTPANNGISLLMIAARRGNLANVDLLLKHGADVNQRDETSNDNRGDTALLVALYAGQEQVVHRLLNAGARMDVKNMWDWGPMHMAAQSDCIPCLELVRSHGFPLNSPAPASRGETPAMLAAARGRLESLKWFVQQGVDLRQEDPHGKTALDWAEFTRRDNTAQWMRQHLARQTMDGR